ncbi:hypothetical protein BUALT_Bualt13G0079200 [Buddleja alternifolia]|uniref:Cysteine proteinase inhibitor n=1 Tax=Buddleja alternifolia TaxID=168488 RepID=A0AAV6WTA4_9LAMI|nr:hypothetical protein BUALT_Bualt13G0079200 [Buddleja alternifolia]
MLVNPTPSSENSIIFNSPMATTLPYDQKAYSQYMDDLNNSQGFYVTPSEDGSALVGGVRPVKEYSDIHHYRKAELAAKFAVEEQNMKGRKHRWLKFIKIVHLNREPAAGAIYYITMAAADSYGEVNHYEAKVREKLNTGYILQLFRLAPYWVTNSDKLSNDCCCIGIDNLLPNMDESYFYYKCFYRARKEVKYAYPQLLFNLRNSFVE